MIKTLLNYLYYKKLREKRMNKMKKAFSWWNSLSFIEKSTYECYFKIFSSLAIVWILSGIGYYYMYGCVICK